jgi:AcrR family transcriptional regulator
MKARSGRTLREDYAEQTRLDIIAAARTLFAENGFFQTKVEDIADRGRVSEATVYARCGGKQGLLQSLMDNWTEAPLVAQAMSTILESVDPDAVMQTLGDAYLQMGEQWGDVTRLVIEVAPYNAESAALLATAQRRHNHALAVICQHLEELGALRDGVDARSAARMITYNYGIDGLLRTREVLGWSLEQSNEWLMARTAPAVLRSPEAIN